MDLKKCVGLLKFGNSEEIKEAKKALDKLWRENRKSNKNFKKFKKELLDLFVAEFENFDEIKNKSNQIAFIGSAKYAFLIADDFEDAFIECFKFVLKLIQSDSGHVRQSILNIADWLLIGIKIQDEFDNGNVDIANKQKFIFGEFLNEIELLSRQHYKKEYGKYKYIQRLPPGIYKSLQYLLAKLLRSESYIEFYKEYKIQRNREEISNEFQKYIGIFQTFKDPIFNNHYKKLIPENEKLWGETGPSLIPSKS